MLVEEYIVKDQKDLVLIFIVFIFDYIEIFYEFDEEVIGELGYKDIVKCVESLNDSFVFIKVLVDLVKIYLDSGIVILLQMSLRCFGCKSDRCYELKKFFVVQELV